LDEPVCVQTSEARSDDAQDPRGSPEKRLLMFHSRVIICAHSHRASFGKLCTLHLKLPQNDKVIHYLMEW
jgi:hypothetical protein